ncbi:Uncharacterized conserved protein, DUF934 family [Methylomagnum ishizawai]|uniref:Uncharacterized conserved protein, DUF934 family n=1 Tax=Methylomagnum ishizawai TaxID=1760988 RepID=A0A1Y6D2T2_9GAMM|nr:DUF934 domain-containing protein [Methylomagnum ishizawai]SMF96700.1 Uncharacterized conserved protein, DUF934 family [Methylomagnum ishizawai]
MAIIKHGGIIPDDWRHIADDEALPPGKASVSLKRWQAEKSELSGHAGLGVRLEAADAPEDIAADLARFDLIVLELAHFADGRVFSQARLLRERFGYAGELRARGDFLRDQMFYLARVGIDAFELAEGVDPAKWLPALTEFSVTYQAAVDNPLPLYRRRA